MADRSLRCTVQARAQEERPAGTAASAPTFVLVEAPLPWPRDVGEHPLLAPLRPVLKAHRARLQALVPASAPDPAGDPAPDLDGPTGPPARLRVIVYRVVPPGDRPPADDGSVDVGPYRRQERLTAPDELVAAVTDLLERDGRAGGEGDSTAVGDVLVCTHGSRDVCCGSDGTALYRELTARALPGVRVWRTSHTGGHRFAPTAVTFPDGRAWAWVDADLLTGILTRSVAADVAARHDRGSTALPDPFAQAADSAALAAEGWSWLDRPRTAQVTVVDAEDPRTVTVTARPVPPAERADGAEQVALPLSAPLPAVTYQAEVVVKRVVPVPDCGRPLDAARKSSPEVEVVALVRHDGQGDPDDPAPPGGGAR